MKAFHRHPRRTPRPSRWWILATLPFWLAGCGGGGGAAASGDAALQALVAATPTSSATCSSDAMTIRIGLDANRNGVLDDGEVSHTQVVCGSGTASLVPEPPGANCPAGGQRVLFGRDADGNGTVEPVEAVTTAYLCNGVDGAPGVDGTNGTNGVDGADGAPGTPSLVATSREPLGTNCPHGGTRVQAGPDTNGNNVLDASEVTHTAYVCDPPPAGLPWVAISADADGSANTGYLVTGPLESTLTLPDDPAPGSLLRVTGAGTGGWRIAQRAGQSIQTGNLPLAARWTGPWTHLLPSGNPQWTAIAASADGRKLVAADVDGVFTSTDFGATWTHRSTPVWVVLNAASSADGTVLALGLDDGGVHVSNDGGVTWTAPETVGVWRVAVSADGSRMVAAPGGPSSTLPIRYSTDRGVTWQSGSAYAHWRAIAMSADGQVVVAGVSGRSLSVSFDGGHTTTTTTSPADNWAALAASADGRYMLAGTFGGPLLVSSDFGATWLPRESARLWATVAMSADGRVMVAGDSGGFLYVSEDFGATWHSRENASTRRWLGLACSTDCSRIVAAADDVNGGLFFAPRSTHEGTGRGLAGEPGSSVELQYLGAGQWTVTASGGEVRAW